MEDDNSLEQPNTGRRVLRFLGYALAGLSVLVVIAYFVVSSSAFVKGVILPRVSKSVNADITVGDASISPFSRVSLTQLKVQPAGADPLLTADQVTVRYSLFSILGGNYAIKELTVVNPVVQIVNQPDGTSNLSALTKGAGTKAPSAKAEGPPHLSIHNVSLKQAVVRLLDKAKDNSVRTTELSPMDLTLDQFENGQSGKLGLVTNLKLENRPAPTRPGTNDIVEGKVNGTFQFKVDAGLLPQSLSGNARLDVSRAAGAYAELAGLGGTLQADTTPTEIRQLALKFERGGQSLGIVQASGPLDLARSEGRVKLEIREIDRQVLNLFGASYGCDFGNTTLNATNSIDLAQQGDVIGAKGQLAARQASVRQHGNATPPLDLDLDYEVSVNRTRQSAIVSKLTIHGRQAQKPLLEASLDRPMTLSWAATGQGLGDSTFQLALTQLDLNDWRLLLGNTNLNSGRLDLQLSLLAKQQSQEMTVKGTTAIQDFAAQFGTNHIEQARLNASLDGTLTQFKSLTVRDYRVEVQQFNRPLLKANGSGQYDLSQQNLNLQANAEVNVPSLLRQFPVPQFSASNGVLRLSTAITRTPQKQSATGNALLADFTGKYGNYSFKDFDAGVEYNANLDGPNLNVQAATLTMRQGYSAGGTVSLTGTYHQTDGAAQVNFKAVDVNQNALRPLLAPSLGDKQLVSISLNGNGSAGYNPKGDASLKAELNLTNWVVADPKAQFVSPNLGAQVRLDGSMQKQVVDLRECLLRLSPTAKAGNEATVKAHLDLGKTNASPSQVTLDSDSFDLTPYYDMFAGNSATNAAPAKAPAPRASEPAAKRVEPEPVSLPISQLAAHLRVGVLYLRTLVLTNLQATANVKGSEITLQPFELKLNGAPVQANALLNLGVPGYTYDLSFKADGVPMEPLARSFSTNTSAPLKGSLTANAKIKGAGLTDLNLKKNLNGNLFLNLTNMTYEIVGP
jgi:hypothetical protein